MGAQQGNRQVGDGGVAARISGGRLAAGREVLAIERDAIDRALERLGAEFERGVQMLVDCLGTVVLTGVGKSGIVARKITATLNSTGTPAFFLHPVDALHGDLGMVQPRDVVVMLSKSGRTPELAQLLPALRTIGVGIVAITAGADSILARNAHVVIDASVEREACPFDLAPTASTTVMLALGDALAVTLYREKGFSREDFATTHPAGAIGRRLLLTLRDLMKSGEDVPIVGPGESFHHVLLEMSRKRLGATLVVDGERLVGIVTDGDLRRLFERQPDAAALVASQMMTPDPMTASADMLGSAALVLLERNKRTQLPVVSDDGRVLGIVHLHDLVEMGLRQ